MQDDGDPREFLISLENADPDAPRNLTVRYFACSDDPAWCKPVEQDYSIHFARDDFRGPCLAARSYRAGAEAGDLLAVLEGKRRRQHDPAPPGHRMPRRSFLDSTGTVMAN